MKNCAGVKTINPVISDIPPITTKYHYRYVLTKHPRSALIDNTGSFVNTINATLIGADKAFDEKTASATYKYLGVGFNYIGNLFSISKNYNNRTYPGYINKLENTPADTPVDIGTFYPYTTSRGWGYSLEDGADPTEYTNYGKLPYSIELTDDLVILDDDTKLQQGDYAFKAFYLTLT